MREREILTWPFFSSSVVSLLVLLLRLPRSNKFIDSNYYSFFFF